MMATDPRLARAPARIITPAQPPPPPPPPEALAQQKPLGGLDGSDEGNTNGVRQDDGSYKLKFCTVCASNQNRYVDRMAQRLYTPEASLSKTMTILHMYRSNSRSCNIENLNLHAVTQRQLSCKLYLSNIPPGVPLSHLQSLL